MNKWEPKAGSFYLHTQGTLSWVLQFYYEKGILTWQECDLRPSSAGWIGPYVAWGVSRLRTHTPEGATFLEISEPQAEMLLNLCVTSS